MPTPTKAPAAKKQAAPKATVTRPSLNAVIDISVKAVIPASDNPRSSLGDLEGLSESILQFGIKQPLLVVPLEGGKNFELVDGHRRFAAAKQAGLVVVPCISQDMDDSERRTVMLITTLHREDLAPLDKAKGFSQLTDLGHSQREVAKLVGVSQATVSKHLAISKLPEKASEWVADGQMTLDSAAVLAALPEPVQADILKDRKSAPDSTQIEYAKKMVDAEAKRNKVLGELEKAGVAVLDTKPHTWAQQGEEGSPLLIGKHGDLSHVHAEEHAIESCHAVFVDTEGNPLPVCTNPDSHVKPGPIVDEIGEARRAREVGDKPADNIVAPSTADEETGDQGDYDGSPEAAKFATNVNKVQAIMRQMGPLYDSAIEVAEENLDMVMPYMAGQILADPDPEDSAFKAAKLLEIEPVEDEKSKAGFRSLIAHVHKHSADAAAATTVLYACALACGDAWLQIVVEDLLVGVAVDEAALGEARAHYEHLSAMTDERVTDLDALLGYGAEEETEAILSDPETMAALAEADAEGDDDEVELEDEPLEREEDSVDGDIQDAELVEDPKAKTQSAIARARANLESKTVVHEGEEAEATITITPKKGKFYVNCSEHGHVGYNTSEDYAKDKASVHMDEQHRLVGASA